MSVHSFQEVRCVLEVYFFKGRANGAFAKSPILKLHQKKLISQEWWYTPIIPVHKRLREEDHEFKANLDYSGCQK
jgi:hypothetical protein